MSKLARPAQTSHFYLLCYPRSFGQGGEQGHVAPDRSGSACGSDGDPPDLGSPRRGAVPGSSEPLAGPRRRYQDPAEDISTQPPRSAPAPCRLTHKEGKRPLLPSTYILGCFMNTRIGTSKGFTDLLKENSNNLIASRDL